MTLQYPHGSAKSTSSGTPCTFALATFSNWYIASIEPISDGPTKTFDKAIHRSVTVRATLKQEMMYTPVIPHCAVISTVVVEKIRATAKLGIPVSVPTSNETDEIRTMQLSKELRSPMVRKILCAEFPHRSPSRSTSDAACGNFSRISVESIAYKNNGHREPAMCQ